VDEEIGRRFNIPIAAKKMRKSQDGVDGFMIGDRRCQKANWVAELYYPARQNAK